MHWECITTPRGSGRQPHAGPANPRYAHVLTQEVFLEELASTAAKEADSGCAWLKRSSRKLIERQQGLQMLSIEQFKRPNTLSDTLP